MRNHIIDHPVELQDENGLILEPGFARSLVWNYDHSRLQAPRMRVKEWDYYLVMTDKFAVAFTISDLAYMRMASVSYLDLEKGTDCTKTVFKPPVRSWTMPERPEESTIEWTGNNLILRYETTATHRHVFCWFGGFDHNADFKADLWFERKDSESMNILTPWPDRKHFYLNEKVNCMPVSGTVVYNWHVHHLDADHDNGILDWGRGWWPYKIHWLWGTCSTMIGRKRFGFSLGYGFGDLSAASENVIFYDGKVHKLDDVTFNIPASPMDPWTLTSSDGRFEAVFTPTLDRKAKTDLGVIKSDQHQYFGRISGMAVLDNGKKLVMDDLVCAFEDIHNQY